MGYTTEVEGRFDCYHAEDKVIGEFLKAIYAGDRTALGVFSDWLIDRDDPRGVQIQNLLRQSVEDLTGFWRLFGLKPEHAAYLTQFSLTRRMKRDPAEAERLPDPTRKATGLPLGPDAAYFVGGAGAFGQDRDGSVLDSSTPPRGQPGLWCQWQPSADGTAIGWDRGEKFYNYVEWLEYLIEHFLAPWGYVLNGEVSWQGEDEDDQGILAVKDNQVRASPTPGGRN